jgi:H+-translocating NAD(P) transhydrogenase
LSIGPQTTKEKGIFQIDMNDDAVQNMLISYGGQARWPDKIKQFSPPPPPKNNIVEEIVRTAEEQVAFIDAEQKAAFVKNTGLASLAAAALLAFGFTSDSPESVSLLATFALAGLAGYQVVWGVAPALHSPLMAVTNAISGMTAVGGLLLLGQGQNTGLVPDSPAHWLGAIATVLSFVNIAGGFLVSGKMLDLFRRPEDPKEYFALYSLPIMRFCRYRFFCCLYRSNRRSRQPKNGAHRESSGYGWCCVRTSSNNRRNVYGRGWCCCL